MYLLVSDLVGQAWSPVPCAYGVRYWNQLYKRWLFPIVGLCFLSAFTDAARMGQMALRPGRTSAPRKTVHIAVDFGTTFASAAYAIDHGNDRAFNTSAIEIIGKYPNGTAWNGRDVNDVPSELLYRDGQKAASGWAWEARNLVKQSKESHKFKKNYATRFKLLLSLKDNTKAIREDLQQRILVEGRSAVDLIVDFLTPLRKHILNFIQNAEDEEAEFKKWTLRWTFTVPADWGPHARRQMKEAAQKAGFEGVMKLISEPEAAALYILEKRAEERKKLTVREEGIVVQ
jgi:molecular chaperone DnaK (HSP70)